MSTPESPSFNRRHLLRSSVGLSTMLLIGCDRSDPSSPSSSPVVSRELMPLRLTLCGNPQDVETITRGWGAVAEHPLQVSLIEADRGRPEEMLSQTLQRAKQTDVLIVPLAMLADLVERELVVAISRDELDAAEESVGELIPAIRNGAARFASETYAIPLGASQPFLLSGEELGETVDSWSQYDRLVDAWDGQAAEPTARGWAAAMFLWRSASERNWLFGREFLEPLIQSESYVQSLQQMVVTCARYRLKSQTPQQVWEGVSTSQLLGGIGFPELRNQLEGNVILHPLPGTSSASRVLLDPFTPVTALAASCRQTEVAKRFMVWMSGGEGSQAVRREVSAMTDTRAQVAQGAEPATANKSNYDRQLANRLSTPVTMPTLQLLQAGEYYSVLDQQVIRAINGEASAEEALNEVAIRWQELTEKIGVSKQLRAWRRAQGMRG